MSNAYFHLKRLLLQYDNIVVLGILQKRIFIHKKYIYILITLQSFSLK